MSLNRFSKKSVNPSQKAFALIGYGVLAGLMAIDCAHASFINGDALSFPAGQNYSNAVADTMTFSADKTIFGPFDNYGKIVTTAAFDSNGNVIDTPYPLGFKVLNNYGTFDALSGYFRLMANSANKLSNKAGGIINISMEYFHIYANSKFENYGAVNFVPHVGQGLPGQVVIFNLFSNTRFDNYGTTRFDTAVEGLSSTSTALTANRGLFEITLRGSYATHAQYTQVSGETRVDGEFSAYNLNFQGGVLTGSGSVGRFPEQLWNTGFSISPGTSVAPAGTLSITPEVGYSVFGDGSLDFVMGGASNNNSQLHVNGEIYIVGSARINVSLKNGFVPSLGNSFTLVTADYVGTDDFNQANLNLPKLPGNLQWQLDNDGTHLKLTVH